MAFAPVTPNNKYSHSFFIQVIDDIGLTTRFIHQLKECVLGPFNGTPN